MNDLILSDLKTEISVGKITTNAAEMLAMVKKGVEKYHDENYIPNEADAKRDRAELNRLEKAVAAEILRIKTKYNEPLEEFFSITAEIRNVLKEGAQVIDGSVKAYEETQKSEKRKEINDYFLTKNFDLVPLEKIFNQKWLNKTVKMAEVKKEIDDTVSRIYSDIQVLERIPEHSMTAKANYLKTLDIGTALREVDILKENHARLTREKIEREERERLAQIAANAKEERQEEREAVKVESVQSLVDEALGFEEPEAKPNPEIKIFRLEIEGTTEKLLMVREYMTAVGVSYRKI